MPPVFARTKKDVAASVAIVVGVVSTYAIVGAHRVPAGPSWFWPLWTAYALLCAAHLSRLVLGVVSKKAMPVSFRDRAIFVASQVCGMASFVALLFGL